MIKNITSSKFVNYLLAFEMKTVSATVLLEFESCARLFIFVHFFSSYFFSLTLLEIQLGYKSTLSFVNCHNVHDESLYRDEITDN